MKVNTVQDFYQTVGRIEHEIFRYSKKIKILKIGRRYMRVKYIKHKLDLCCYSLPDFNLTTSVQDSPISTHKW